MNNQNKMQKTDEEIWYIIINNQTRGPLSLRDLDVLLRTNQINSRTYGWKNGMKQWKIINDIQQIKDSILQSSKQIMQIQKKREELFQKNGNKNEQNKNQNEQVKQSDTIQNKDQDVLVILEATVQNLIKKTFHQTQDGKWNIYDEEKGQWLQQQEEPVEQVQIMKKNLFNKLKSELFFDHPNLKKKKPNTQINKPQQIEQKPLTEEELLKKQRNRKKTKRAAQKKKEKWYNAKVNTFIYISGLPFDITEEQLKNFASKAGVIRIDLNTGTEKIKIYKDQNGLPKGDAAISFARQQSVDIALQMLNESQIRTGFKVKVQKANFEQKNQQYKPRQTKKQTKVKKIQAKKIQQKLFGWNSDDNQDQQGLKIVIMKHIFTTQMAKNDQYIQSIKKQITDELSKIGEIHRLKFYQTHPEGVVQVKFKKAVDAQQCISIMNGRFYEDRQIQCQYWDGQTDYKHNSISLLIQKQRLQNYADELQGTQQKGQNQQEKIKESLQSFEGQSKSIQ